MQIVLTHIHAWKAFHSLCEWVEKKGC